VLSVGPLEGGGGGTKKSVIGTSAQSGGNEKLRRDNHHGEREKDDQTHAGEIAHLKTEKEAESRQNNTYGMDTKWF